MKMKISMWIAAALFVPAAMASYKCVDEKGITRIGDTPPPECDHVPMYEMSSSGTVLRKIEPTPTAAQVKTRQDEQEKAKEAERAGAEQKRKDMALLSSYSNEKEIDVARDRNIEPITGRMKNAQDRIVEVDKRIKDLEEEMEFYKSGSSAKSGKAKDPPAVLVANLDRAKTEKTGLEKSIVGYKQEIEVMKLKYDTDKKRWMALKTGTVERPDLQAKP